jgi:hypothetical protein
VGESTPDPAHLRRLAQAFADMDYHLVVATDQEAALLKEAGSTLPVAVFGPEPTLRTLATAHGPVAAIIFPATASPQNMHAVEAMAQTARSSSGLVIGISPWGADAETAFLAAYPQALDILLGAGPGPGSGGLFSNNGAQVWLRPYAGGKAVGQLRIPSLPAPGTKVSWKPGESLWATAIPLTDTIPDDPYIRSLFP